MHYIVFDTNIYREFGVNFNKNIDFNNLSKFIEKGPHEIVLLEVVYKELLDYFKYNHLGKLISDYQDIYLRFNKNDFVKNIDLIDLTRIENDGLNEYKKTLRKPIKVETTIQNDISTLIDFLIYNKRKSRKDNTRDFLILMQLIDLAKSNPEDKVIFISRDKIFTEDAFFIKTIKSNLIHNIEIIKSVSSYFMYYGLQVDFLNEKVVLDFVPRNIIQEELIKDSGCLPSYVSNYYYTDKVKPPKNISLEILSITVNDYYTYSEKKNETIIVSTYIANVKAVFDKELRVDLKDFEQDLFFEEIKHRIDNQNRIVYENNILFIFEGEVDIKNQKIINQRFIDFLPDWNVSK